MQYEEFDVWSIKMPWWLGFEPFHASHRSNLLRKDPEFYSLHNWKDDPKDPYIWHDKEGKWYQQYVGIPRKIYLEKVVTLRESSYI